AAGLDAMLKALIREALPFVLAHDAIAQNAFEKFVTRQLRPDAEDSAINSKFLGKVLSSSSPQRSAIEMYIRQLTGGSLQSSASLYDVVAALGLLADQVSVDRKELDPIFSVRNKIIHELDIADIGSRTRSIRSRAEMIRHTDHLLLIGEKILTVVDA